MFNSTTAKTLFKNSEKFRDPLLTADGKERAVVGLTRLRTIWFNTGSLCNITCKNCYMGSSPTNDALIYLKLSHVIKYLEDISEQELPVEEIAFTGGEPFMNKEFTEMMNESLSRGFRVLVLTNAMKPLQHHQEQLRSLKDRYGDALALRVSVDHYTLEGHEKIRGAGTWAQMMEGLQWLSINGFNLNVAGRICFGEPEAEARLGYGEFFRRESINIDEEDRSRLVLFPEMDVDIDVPEITVGCWDILGIRPETIMCASSRMIVHKKGAKNPVIVPCTLLPYDAAFELGNELSKSASNVRLNHPHCAKFCVLGGASCSP